MCEIGILFFVWCYLLFPWEICVGTQQVCVGTSSLCCNYRARAITRDRTREERERERAKSVYYKHELLLLMLPGLPVVRSANNPIKENNGSPPADIPPPLANYTPLNMSPSARSFSNRKVSPAVSLSQMQTLSYFSSLTEMLSFLHSWCLLTHFVRVCWGVWLWVWTQK